MKAAGIHLSPEAVREVICHVAEKEEEEEKEEGEGEEEGENSSEDNDKNKEDDGKDGEGKGEKDKENDEIKDGKIGNGRRKSTNGNGKKSE